MLAWIRMFGSLIVFVGAGAAVTSGDFANAATPELDTEAITRAPGANACVPREQCCKVCSKGKACGNTCISRNYECHKGTGCACNADDVCAAAELGCG